MDLISSLALFIGFFKTDFIFSLTGVKSFLTLIKLTGNIKKKELMEIEINVFIILGNIIFIFIKIVLIFYKFLILFFFSYLIYLLVF